MLFASRLRLPSALLTVTAASLSMAIALLCARASHAQQLTGTLTAGTFNVDLTAQGTTDWAVWGYSGGGTSTSLVRDVGKVGGNSISSLTDFSNGNPLRGLGQFGFYGESAFSWSDGTPTASATNAATGIQHNGTTAGNSTVGEGFSFTVPASTSGSTAYLYFTVNQAAAQLTATLSGSSPMTYSSSLDTGLDSNNGYLLTLQYTAASAGQTLTVKGAVSTDNSGGHTGNFAVDAVALASSASSSANPEPGSLSLLASAALAGAPAIGTIARRRHKSA